jgi:hypothetical protein
MVAHNDPDEQTLRLASESLSVGDDTGWFERLYAAAEDGEAVASFAFDTVGFDMATATQVARRRSPGSSVMYVLADPLDPPPE